MFSGFFIRMMEESDLENNNQEILRVDHITKNYPGVKALNDVSIEFRKGEVHALIGENGAGKSTLIKIIAGAIQPDGGSITIGGQTFNAMDVNLAKENGIQVIYQEFTNVRTLSAAENVYLGERTGQGVFVNTKERERKAEEIFKQLGVDLDPRAIVGELSPACQQIVEIAKAVSKNAKIIVMDEPTAPLTVNEVSMLFKIIRDLKEKGVTIIYISHRLEELFEIADRITVMRDGAYITTQNTDAVDRKKLISYMVGRELEESYPTRKIKRGKELLRVENLCGNGNKNINFSLQAGEILGFGGLVGAGRTELMEVIYGAVPKQSGKVFLKEKEVSIHSPSKAIEMGIGLVPEDRKGKGAFLKQSIAWNTTINCLKQYSSFGFINFKKEKAKADDFKSKFDIRTPSLEQHVGNLSGGNQQKVVLAKTMAADSDVIIFDEPTRGIDVGAKQEIYHLINQLAQGGKGILLVSSDMPELLGMCDRIVVIAEGVQTGTVEKQDFNQEHILNLSSAAVSAV
jgi:ABC-type sugar transport system, ATPase component